MSLPNFLQVSSVSAFGLQIFTEHPLNARHCMKCWTSWFGYYHPISQVRKLRTREGMRLPKATESILTSKELLPGRSPSHGLKWLCPSSQLGLNFSFGLYGRALMKESDRAGEEVCICVHLEVA